MAIDTPDIGQSAWGPPLNAVLSTLGQSAFNPPDLAYRTWNFPPWHAIAYSSTQPVSGTVVMMRMPQVAQPETMIGVTLYRAVAAVGLTDAYVGLYNAAGTRLAVSANVSGTWGATGMQQTAFTAPYAATANSVLFAAMLFVGATPPGIAAAQIANHQSNMNGQTTAATALWATGPAAQTTLPASVTMASRTPIVTGHWAGLH